MYKPTKKCLRMNISPGLIFGGLWYLNATHHLKSILFNSIQFDNFTYCPELFLIEFKRMKLRLCMCNDVLIV